MRLTQHHKQLQHRCEPLAPAAAGGEAGSDVVERDGCRRFDQQTGDRPCLRRRAGHQDFDALLRCLKDKLGALADDLVACAAGCLVTV
jgi:predicted aminopeptidase